MTLIAAFRTDEGIAICADTQETVSDQYGDEYRAGSKGRTSDL
jgi:hypothetical protein